MRISVCPTPPSPTRRMYGPCVLTVSRHCPHTALVTRTDFSGRSPGNLPALIVWIEQISRVNRSHSLDPLAVVGAFSEVPHPPRSVDDRETSTFTPGRSSQARWEKHVFPFPNRQAGGGQCDLASCALIIKLSFKPALRLVSRFARRLPTRGSCQMETSGLIVQSFPPLPVNSI